MSSLKDALIRVSRVARNIEQAKLPLRPPSQHTKSVKSSQFNELPSRERISKKELKRYREQLKGFQKKRFQSFLKPLNMPELKIFDEDLPKYDSARAEANHAVKSSKDRVAVFNTFLSERFTFNKMLDFLVQLTPQHLKCEKTVSDPAALGNVLKQQDDEFRKNKYDVPRYHFGEVPPFPQPLTKESFQEYIFFLTHVRMPYKNSSSLLSGVIPEILLYTHSLKNDSFKELRSVETYNYLIKFFGYDKFQASFAKELLLVMAADGKQPNLETINELLKICRSHSTRRSLVSSYSVILRYLSLIKRMDISVNLTTWARIYECITNIFLREVYVNKMSSINLPILSHMCVRILEDFCQTTQNTQDVVDFLCNELRRPGWREDPRLAEKVVLHIVSRAKNALELKPAFDLLHEVVIDETTINALAKEVYQNEKLNNRTLVLLYIYTRFDKYVNAQSPEVIGNFIKAITTDDIALSQANFLLRCIVHEDSVQKLNLPVEFNKHADLGKPKPRNHQFPYPIPTSCIPEHYRIMKRLTGDHMTDFEARVIHNQGDRLPIPWDPLSESEKVKWGEFKELVSKLDPFWFDIATITRDLGLEMAAKNTPPHLIKAYRKLNAINTGISRDINLVHRLKVGLDEHLKKELEQRKIRFSQ